MWEYESVPKDCDVRVLGEAMDLLDWSVFDAKRVAKEMEAIDRIFAEAEEVDRREDELYGSGTGCAHQCGRS